jgi:hypothetical protein
MLFSCIFFDSELVYFIPMLPFSCIFFDSELVYFIPMLPESGEKRKRREHHFPKISEVGASQERYIYIYIYIYIYYI